MNLHRGICILLAGFAGLGPVQSEEMTPERAAAVLQALVAEARPDAAFRARIEATVDQLGVESFRAREQAMRDLRKVGRPAVTFLEQVATGTNPEARFRALQLLEEVQGMGESLPTNLRPALELVREAGDSTLIDDLIALLNHYNKCVRHVAAYTLRDATGEARGFRALSPPAERQAAVARWEVWRREHHEYAPAQPGDGQLLVNHYEGRFSVVDLDGRLVWSKSYPGRLACVIPTDRNTFLVSTLDDHRLREIDLDLKEQWSWQVPEAAEGGVYGLQQLPGGGLLLGIGYSKKYAAIELNAKREITWHHPVPAEGDCVVGRALRQPDGSTILPFEWGNQLLCLGKDGSERWRRDLDAPRRVYRLANGNLLTTSGTAVVELNQRGETVWEYPCGTHPFDAVRLPDGQTVILVEHRGILLVDVDGGAPYELMASDLRFGSLAYFRAEAGEPSR